VITLDAAGVAYYLLGRRLVTRADVIDSDFLVIDASRRNCNFKIRRSRETSLFVKQVRAADPESVAALQREAACYRLAQSDPAFAPLAALVPVFRYYDEQNLILVVELVVQSENLREHYQRVGRFDPTIFARLGTAIGRFHAAMVAASASSNADVFPRRTPWILSFHDQPRKVGAQLGAHAQLYRILHQYPDFSQRLTELREAWRTESLIHGDMKWDNCLVCERDGSDDLGFKIVDWELADVGDVCWDLGGILQSYLSSWVFSMPETGNAHATALVERAQYRLDDMQPAIAAFWQAYTSARALDKTPAREMLDRSMQYGAARLVQTAYEISMHGEQLDAFAIRLLQLSENILASPREAVEHLLAT
jgi:5-methylthioribose kinase